MFRKFLFVSVVINILAIALLAAYITNKNGLKRLFYSIVESSGLHMSSSHEDARWSFFKKAKMKNDSIVLLGDSLIEVGEWNELFPELPIVNRGVSGQTLRGLIGRSEELQAMAGRQTMILIGINDVWQGRSVDDIKEDYVRLIETVREMKHLGRVSFISLLPVFHGQIVERNGDIRELNKFLAMECESKKIGFVDMHARFTDKNGELQRSLSYDGVHLNGDGYSLMKEILEPLFLQP